MNILGISCFYHDAAAALLVDGRLVAAASEERFSRIKHDPDFPRQAARFCVDKAGVKLSQIDYVVFYDKPITKFDRILTGLLATPARSYRAALHGMPLWLGRNLHMDRTIRRQLEYDGEILYSSHHLSHAAGAYFCSPFERAAILTVDGVGEWASASWGIGEANRVRLMEEMTYPHSVGLLYSAFTYYLGFRVNSAEYKVMGLAPYGQPRYVDLILSKLVRIHDDGSIHLNLDYFTYQHGLTMIGKRFERLFARPRRRPGESIEPFHEDMAASIQQVTERIILSMAQHVRCQTNLSNLCLAGGVALNCRANGLLHKARLFDEIYVQPAAGDAGGAVGGALYAYYRLTGAPKQPQPFFSLGPSYDRENVRGWLDSTGVPYTEDNQDGQARRVARALADGKIIGLFQGPMEFGPRALGFRSILADPRNPRMKEQINAAVKYREPFRPFAPAVMKEHCADYFDCSVDSPYMLVNFTVRENRRAVIPAVTHVDNSARLQTVTRDNNPMLYDILAEFHRLTGVPVLLNTSLNLRGHPIVNRPEEALATFCSGGIDILLVESFLIEKSRVPATVLRRFHYTASGD